MLVMSWYLALQINIASQCSLLVFIPVGTPSAGGGSLRIARFFFWGAGVEPGTKTPCKSRQCVPGAAADVAAHALVVARPL